MFYYLKGKAVLHDENFLVLDIGGVGYKIFTSQATLSQIKLNTEITVFTYTYIREDVFDIFGFLTKEELAFFQKLISVSGVGPRLALAILSTLSPHELMIAVLSSDAKKISRTPGVGPKLAQRMILELKDKIKDDEVETVIASPSSVPQGSSEAVNALLVLGYGEEEARRAVASVGEGFTLEDTIKKALLHLVR